MRVVLLKRKLTSFQIIIIGFSGVIIFGTFLLMLPFSSSSGLATPFFEALFTSTSAVCVTGLIIHDTATYWSVFGQIVILLLIQIGGMGSYYCGRILCNDFRAEDFFDAAQYHAGSDFSAKGRGIVRLTGFIVR
mgnify:CR=1 FL=1